MEPYWDAANGLAPHSVKYESEAAVSSFPYCPESSLNFSTSATAYSEDDAEYATGRRNKTSRQDPLSHRIIEKRRRDRMNSCLADLSRLIPPQYQRKGRGRIEKTEIIEMAIRHLKHLQNECLQKENEYRLGYTDCMKEAAKFLCDSQMQDFCYRMVTRLQEHCDEVLLKNDCYKARCHPDNISASSGSPHNGYHPAAPLSQLRDILASDIEHSNSNDHNDVKDLSFRNSQPHQAPVITSTAPPSLHHDSSNHDFDSSREPLIHHETANMHSPPPHPHNSVDSLLMQAARMRNFSESSHDIEHNNNYKYKNHIKERFNQDHLHDETSSEHFPAPPTLQSDHSISEHSKDDLEIASSIAKKRKLENGSGQSSLSAVTAAAAAASSGESKALSFSDIKSELSSNSTTSAAATKLSTNPSTITTSGRHFAVPIFALHGQGTYYVPLNIDFNSLVPYLNGVDLLDKNYAAMPVLHPININVNFSPIALTKHQQPSKAKIEAITNGW